MKKKIFLTLGAFAMCAGLTVCIPNTVLAASKDAVINTVSSEYTGWVENDNGTMSYYQDGEMIKSKVFQIGSSYYYFLSSGELFQDGSLQTSVYDEDYGDWVTVRYMASETGELYRNKWGKGYLGWYYFTDDCSSARGLTNIDGKTYYFDMESCKMAENEIVTVDEENYIANNQGELVKVNNDGWIKVSDYWYYFKGGEFLKEKVEKIGTYYYYFDEQGRMITDNYLFIWDSNTDRNIHIYIKADGTLYRNEWIEWGGQWSYAMDDGSLATGVQKIGQYSYLFTTYATLMVNRAFDVDGIGYASDENGVATKLNNNAWTQVGKYWYYTKDNKHVYDTFITISGKNYVFDYAGRMLADATMDVYDSATGTRQIYRAKADGSLYQNEWYRNEFGSWYYYGNDSKLYTGLKSVDGKLYYFGDYGIYQNTTFTFDGVYYRADVNGVLTKLANNVWTYADGAWYYIKDNNMPESEILLIGGVYYAFDAYGKMRTDERFYSNINFGGSDYYGVHRAKANGVLCKNEWYQNGDEWEYYGNNTIGLEGIHTISGNKYYFEDGRLCESGYAYADYSKAYLIGPGGVLITNKRGWYAYNGEWYYMNSDGSLYMGILELGGKLYGLWYNMIHNSDYIIYNDELYQAKDGSGVLTKITAEGSYTGKEFTYYVSNGKVYRGWKYIQGAWRYFNDYGFMVDDDTNYYIDGNYYAFDVNGAMYENRWVNDYVYATSTGALATGEYTIDGKKYYFSSDGWLLTTYSSDNGEFVINGIKYKFKQGWNSVNGEWYYLKGNELLEGEQLINGKVYYFTNNRVMLTNDFCNWSYFGSDGAALTGWFTVDGDWYYANRGHILAAGLVEVNGYKYYFIGGRMATSDVLDSGTIYKIGTDGVVKELVAAKDGWNYVGFRAYYYRNGSLYTGWLGDSYIEYGEMVFDRIIYGDKQEGKYYVNKEGKYVRNTWIKPDVNGGYTYFYAGSDGKLKCDGWAMINGSWYYFDEHCAMMTGLVEENGVTYFLDHNGRLIRTFNRISDGWYQLDGEWLYAINGRFLVDEVAYIDGKFYEFGYDGCMTTYTIGWRTYGSDGAMKVGTGWYQSNGLWFYLGLEGEPIRNDWLEINGNKYYFDIYMVTGYYVVDDELYYFDNSGVCKGKRGVTNGWYQAGGSWYYFVNGKVVTGEMMKINGIKYAFDTDGKMRTNALVTVYNNVDGIKYYYFGSDGAETTKEGIYHTADGGKVYIAKDGNAYVGTVYVNGKLQNMDAR